MKKVNIVFDANPLVLPKSGVGYFTHGFVQALTDTYPDDFNLTGHYFNFLGRKRSADLPASPSITYRTTRFFPTKLLNILRRLGIQLPLEVFIRQKADIVLFPNFVSLPTLRKPLRIVVIHDLAFVDCPEYVAARNQSFLDKWTPRSIKSADIVLAVSEFTKQRIAEVYGIAGEKIHVLNIPPGKMDPPDDKIIDRYKLRQGYILFVGNIEPRKNIVGLLAGYEQLPGKIRDRYPLVLVGGPGWNDDEIVRRIKKLQDNGCNIIQTGYVSGPERSALYKYATIYVQPSHYEGFGMPILEAMSQGKPVLCSDLPVFREMARDAAIFFDQENPKEIAGAMERVLGGLHLREKLVRLGKERVTSYPTWTDVARRFHGVVLQRLKERSLKD